MIRLLEPGREDDLIEAVRGDPIIGVRVYGNFRVYGFSVDTWIQYRGNRPVAAFQSAVGGRYHLSAGQEANLDELSAYFRSCGFSGIFSSPALCDRLTDMGKRYAAPIMEYRGAPFSTASQSGISEEIPLLKVYRLLGEVTEWFFAENPWESWYTYTSHLVRHRLGKVCGILRDGETVSTASILAIGEQHALIGNIATRGDARGNGLAAGLIRNLVNTALEMGKTPCLYCAEESLAAYYGSLGFCPAGQWAKIDVLDS